MNFDIKHQEQETKIQFDPKTEKRSRFYSVTKKKEIRMIQTTMNKPKHDVSPK